MSDRITRWEGHESADTLLSTPPHGESPSRVGDVLAGRFELVAHLGSGGMGSVYLARDRQLDDDVAIKLLHRSISGADSLELLRREVKLARRVTSPNVARIHELIDDDGEWFLTMEFIDGVPLADMIAGADERLPVPRVVAILETLCQALDAVHEAGLVHGDVKPANIMVARDGRVVLADFGIARFADTGGDSRQVVGTPAYMAPEQVTGSDVDRRSDLYAVGVVAFELLTGDQPFLGRNAIEVASARLVKEPPDIAERCPEISRSLAATVAKLMARDPEDRPATAAAARALFSTAPPDQRPITSVDIVDLYLNAQWLYRQFEHSTKAVDLFERACRQAPDSAIAHAGYASALVRKWMLVGVDTEQLAETAKRAAARATKLGPYLGESQMARGSIALHLGEPALAARAFRRAMMLSPGLADAHSIASAMALEIGHFDEAKRRFETARRLDPTLESLRVMSANAEALCGDWSGVDQMLANEIKPATLTLMMAVRASAYREDRAALERLAAIAARSTEPPSLLAPALFNRLAELFLAPDGVAEVEALMPVDFAGVSRRRLSVTMQLRAEVAGRAGDIELAIASIDVADRDGALIDRVWIDRCPLLDGVRADPRFAPIAERVRERAAAVARGLGIL